MGFDESVCYPDRPHNPFDEVYGVSCLRENLTSSSYGEGLETGRLAPRQSFTRQTSFRALKYTVGLTNFHAKRQESIIQEIFARMIMYNFAEMMTSHVVISQMDKRHHYQVNFTVAVHVCSHFLRSRGDGPPPDVEALIRKNILPIRPIRQGQKNTRKIRYKSAVSFVYRVA
jgi:hypothetical protein